MSRDRLLRRTWALLLALATVLPAGSGLLAAGSAAPHECTDHACFCRRAAAGAPPAPCHGPSDAHGAQMTPTCSHDTDPVQVAAVRPALLPEPSSLPLVHGSRGLPAAAPHAPCDGFRTVESPPPQPTRSARA